MSVRIRLAVGAVILVMAGTGIWYFTSHRHSGALVLYGNVDIRQVDLAFAVDGPLKEMLVDEGDAVKAGQPLARLEDASYRHSLAQAEANAAQAHAARAKAERGSRTQEIDSARATVNEARAVLKNAQATLERRQQLVKENTVSRQALDDAQRDMNVARATLNAREAALRLAEEGFRNEDIDAARAAAAAADAAVGLALYRLEKTQVNAPDEGTILTRIREPGSMVGPSAPVFTLALTNPVWIRTYVDEPYLGKVAPGTKVNVKSDNPDGKTYTGTVGFVSPTAEFTPKTVETPELRSDLVYRVRIVVDAPDKGLRQGMPVTVSFP